MTDIAQRLAAPFPPDAIEWRIGPTNKEKTRGMALAYIDARDVMNRLDDVAGPFGWQSDHVVSANGMVTCRISVLDPESGEWIAKSDGAGKTDVEGEKGSYSDALKRAAVAWGIGRYLYATESPWVAVEPAGNSYRIKDSERPKLLAALPPHHGSPPTRARPMAMATRVESVTDSRKDIAVAAADPFAPAPTPPEIVAGEHGAGMIGTWWTREDYALHPDVIDGGPRRWGWWFREFAAGAPDLAAFLKLKADNRENHKLWAATAQAAAAKRLVASLSEIERGLAAGRRAAA